MKSSIIASKMDYLVFNYNLCDFHNNRHTRWLNIHILWQIFVMQEFRGVMLESEMHQAACFRG